MTTPSKRIQKNTRWAGHVVRMEKGRSVFKSLTGKPTGKKPLNRPRRSFEANTRVDLGEISINTRNWVDSNHDRDYWISLVNVAMNLQVL